MNKKFNILNRNKISLNIKTLNFIIDLYNRNLYKYTNSYYGKIPKIKEDFQKISSKKYMSLEEYLNSVPVWSQINDFLKDLPEHIKIQDYIDMFFKNWNLISINLNIDKIKKPLPRILFSSKLIYLYDKFTKKETEFENINKHLNYKKNEDFYRLTPSLQSNVISLFKLKNLNPDLNFKEIMILFNGEFESDFVKKVNSLKEEDINEDNLLNIFK